MSHELIIKQAQRQIFLLNLDRSAGFPNPLNFDKEVVDKDIDLCKTVKNGT